MARYIDIDKMKRWTEVDQKSCSRENCGSTDYDCNECYYNNGGAEDVEPVVHARWKRNIADFFVCSNCHYIYGSREYAYCPNCGAKMDNE